MELPHLEPPFVSLVPQNATQRRNFVGQKASIRKNPNFCSGKGSDVAEVCSPTRHYMWTCLSGFSEIYEVSFRTNI